MLEIVLNISLHKTIALHRYSFKMSIIHIVDWLQEGFISYKGVDFELIFAAMPTPCNSLGGCLLVNACLKWSQHGINRAMAH